MNVDFGLVNFSCIGFCSGQNILQKLLPPMWKKATLQSGLVDCTVTVLCDFLGYVM